MKSNATYLFLTIGIFFLGACSNNDSAEYVQLPDLEERMMAGGETTTFISSSNAYGMPASNLSAEDLSLHLTGDLIFEFVFVTPPNQVNQGLGPIFNNSSCISCHPKDGRAAFPVDLAMRSGFFLRGSVPGVSKNGGPMPIPGFGLQLQNQAVFGTQPEVEFQVNYSTITEEFADGTKVVLQKPHYSVINAYRQLPNSVLLSPRIGMPVFGLGLLEAIPEQDILANQDIDDADKDGISGKANYVFDAKTQSTKLGRFGWKANTASLLEQCAAAFVNDIGITNYLFPNKPGLGQSNGDYTHDVGDYNWRVQRDIKDDVLDAVTFYTQTLAVPASRNHTKESVRKGAKTFDQIGCAKCHIAKHKTGYSPIKALSYQTIYPYTDMLLHDMGDDLADNRPDFLADGNEWKTRPLWGIGYQYLVNGHTEFLHDGRAKNLTEAILWHGGEALDAKNRFKALSKQERENLLDFLNSL
ncbi:MULTISPECIES: di-heme oxidoredictase family protein [Myroides]|uniref:di-heme oxidoreductase family protein n=1 Tax=Myroides TaxID=76831 RepID=UPI001329D435|nr:MULTISPECIES: di-heme oxidoredictase family protein [Myroides]MVX34672.1 c-type cytochrome [Myroides sp. LoEW2-1]UVD79511.1 c-type cytochrome [Myroides albus]